MKRLLVWIFREALAVEVDGVRYVPDWEAIAAVATAAAAMIGLVAIWYSVQSLRRQLRHQTELEAKKLEERLLLRVIDLVQVPYDASKEFIADIVTWRLSGGPARNPEFLSVAARKAVDVHRSFSSATAVALSVLRRSRPRRFPRGTTDVALNSYDDLVQRAIRANGCMLEYCARDFATLDLDEFERTSGSEAFSVADLLRRVTGDLLARMYASGPEWAPLHFEQVSQAGSRVGFNFADDPPLGV